MCASIHRSKISSSSGSNATSRARIGSASSYSPASMCSSASRKSSSEVRMASSMVSDCRSRLYTSRRSRQRTPDLAEPDTRARSELPAHLERPDRPDLPVQMLDEGDGRVVAPAVVDRAVPHAVGEEEGVHAGAHGQAVHVLVLHVQAAPGRPFPEAADLREPVVLRIELVRSADAPRPGGFRDVAADLDAAGAQQGLADRALLAGERILRLAVLIPAAEVDARAAPAEAVEIERAVRLDAVDRGVVDVAGRLAGRADGDVVDDVVDLAAVQLERGRADGAEVAHAFDRELPRLLGDEVGLAGAPVLVLQVDRGEEVEEVQLPDAAGQLDVDVRLRRDFPRRGQLALRAMELARQPAAADLRELRVLRTRGELHRQAGGHRPPVAADHLIAVFLDLRRAAGERQLIEASIRLQLEQSRRVIEAVERPLGGDLPLAAVRLPAILRAADHLALGADLVEAIAGRIRAVGEAGDDGDRVRILVAAPEADQLEPAAPEVELVVAADFVVVAMLVLGDEAMPRRAGDRGAVVVLEVVEVDAAVREIEIALRRAAIEHESPAEARLVVVAAPLLVARLHQAAALVEDPRRAARAAAVAAVVEAERVLHRSLLAADRDVESREERIGVVRAELRPVLPLSGHAGRLDDDVRTLTVEPRDVERGAVDDLDALDVAGRNAPELRDHVVVLARQPLPVDDDVARRLAEPARLVLLLDGEAGNAVEHVERRARRELHEVGGGIRLHRRRGALRERGEGDEQQRDSQ